MYNELTENDIKKMEKEIEYRTLVVRKEALEDVKTARAHGDLSENFEYHAAKREKNRNESRIRYLQRMIKTAKIISDESADDEVGVNNIVELFYEDDETTEKIKLVTTVRGDSLEGLISIESPLGKALLGHKAKDFIQRAFTVIFFATIIIWFLETFDAKLNVVKDSSDSLLALIGQAISPIFKPLGFADWRVTTSLISGFTAKEAVVSTMAVLMNTSTANLGTALSGAFSTLSALSFLVFTLLYTPWVILLITLIFYFSNYYFYLYVIFTAISVAAVLWILNDRINPAYKIVWILPIVVFPMFGGF